MLFVAWFASGAVLHFIGFPSLPLAERRAQAEPLNFSQIKISPAEALKTAALPDAEDIRLISINGQPRYLISSPDQFTMVSADNGQRIPALDTAAARRVAEHFGRASSATVAGPFDYDQWVVHQQFDRARPFFRVRLDDALATDLYVSARTGEVLQRTRSNERAWNWTGAVLHWIYFTPIRKDWSLWDRLVWWVSLGALLTSAIGVWLGVIRTLAIRRLNRTRWTPFRGWVRWHHLIGLFASVVVVAWMLSGWLSMDHGRLFSPGDLATQRIPAMRGMSLQAMSSAASLEKLASAAPASEISLNAIGGRAFLTVRAVDGETRAQWLDTGETTQGPLPDELIVSALRHTWQNAELIGADSGTDRLYRLAESIAPDALGARVGATDSADRVYVDRETGRLLCVMDGSRRTYAWIYYGLHTLNFPGLNAHPALRTAIVVAFVLLGLAFSITGVIVGVRRLQLQFR